MLSSDELLSTTTTELKKSMEYAVHQIRSKKVPPDLKIRWMRTLNKQAETLVKIAEARRNTESKLSNLDLATYLSSVRDRIPENIGKQARTLRRAEIDLYRTVRRTTGMHSRTCH